MSQKKPEPSSRAAMNDARLAYSIDDAARLLSVSRRHLYELINEGSLPSAKLGARRVIPRSALERLLAEAEADEAKRLGVTISETI